MNVRAILAIVLLSAVVVAVAACAPVAPSAPSAPPAAAQPTQAPAAKATQPPATQATQPSATQPAAAKKDVKIRCLARVIRADAPKKGQTGVACVIDAYEFVRPKTSKSKPKSKAKAKPRVGNPAKGALTSPETRPGRKFRCERYS